MARFKKRVLEIVRKIPEGKVVSYGQAALMAGFPRGARQVGWILNQCNENIPWWRVINNEGRISIKGSKFAALDQKILLEKEGVRVSKDFKIEIEKYRFHPTPNDLSELDNDYVDLVMEKW